MAPEASLPEKIDVSADDSVMQTAVLLPSARDDGGTTPDSAKKSRALLPSTGDENGTKEEPVRGSPAILSTEDDVKPEEGKDGNVQGETGNAVIAKFSQDVIGILKKSSTLDDPLYISQLVDDIKMVENRTGVDLEGEKASKLPLLGTGYVDTEEDKEETPAKVETEDAGESVATDCDIHKQEESVSCEREDMAEKNMKGEKVSAPTKIGTDHAGQSQVTINKQEDSAISTQENERKADEEGERAAVQTLVETGFPGESISTPPIDIDKQQAPVVASRDDGTEQDRESVKGVALMTVQTEGSRDLVATQSDICKEEKPALRTREDVGSLKDVGVPALETDYVGGLMNTQYDKHKQDESVSLTRVEAKTFQAVERSDFKSCQQGSTFNSSTVCQELVDVSEKKDFNQIDAKPMEHEQDIDLTECRKDTEGLSTRETCDISNAHEKGIVDLTHTNPIIDKEVSGEIELRTDLESMDTKQMCGVVSDASGKEDFPLVYAKPVIGIQITGKVGARENMEGICTSEARGTTSYASDKGDTRSSDQVISVEIEHGESGQADDVIRNSHYENLSTAGISMGNIVTNTDKDAKKEIQEDKYPHSLAVEHQTEIENGLPETEILATKESEALSSKEKQERVSACYLASQQDEVEQVDKSSHKIIYEEHHAGDHIPEPHSLMDSEKEISAPSLVGGNSSGAHIVSEPTLLSDCYAKPCATQEIEQHDVSIEESMNVDSSTSLVAEVAAVSPTTIPLLNANVHVSSTSETDNVMERPVAKGLLNHDENAHNFSASEGSLSHNALEMISSERNHKVSRIISDEPANDDGQMELEETKGEDDECVLGKEEMQDDDSDQQLPMEAQELDDSGARVSESDNENDDFKFGDLVWAKVRSHPWWPAQIFDPEDASKSAIQSRKTGRFLVAFFGDCTFAWVQPSELIEFRSHFKAKAKKTTKIFCKAVDEALEEICQRSELGLVCKLKNYEGTLYSKDALIDKEVGILKASRIQKHRDVLSSINKFSPDRTLKFLKDVACSPFSSWNAGVDMSELRGHAYGLRAYIISSNQEGKEGDESLMSHGKRLFSSLDFALDECQEAKKVQQKNTEATPGKRKDSVHYKSDDDTDMVADVNNEHFIGDDAGFGKDKSSILKRRKGTKGSKRTSRGLATKGEEIKDEGEEASHEIGKRTKKSKYTEPPASLEELEMTTEIERKNGMGKVSKVTKSVQGKNTGTKGGSTNKSSIYMKFGASMRKVASELTGALPLGKCLDKSNAKGIESIPEKQASFEQIAHGRSGEAMKPSKQEQGANVKEIPIKKAARDSVQSRKRQEVVPRASKSKVSKITEKEAVKHFGEHDLESDLSKGNRVESPKHIEKGMIKYARRPPRKSKSSSVSNEGGEVLPENACVLPLGEEKDMECYRPESPAAEAGGDSSPSSKHECIDIEQENQRNDEEGGNIQDQLMTLLRQVSVIVATPPHNSDTASK